MNIFLSILLNWLLQMALTVGGVFLLGGVIALCNSMFYKNFGSGSRFVCYATGAIGTPIHELSHALMCLIFGHKIDEICLFDPDPESGTLGYVTHSYNERNFYHRIGNLFIGTAPVIIGSALLCLLLWALLPEFFGNLFSTAWSLDFSANFFVNLWEMICAVFSIFTYIFSWQWWVFFLVGGMIALHMTLSNADLRGIVPGLLFLLGVGLTVDFVVGLISRTALGWLTQTAVSFAVMLAVIFIIFLLILAILTFPVLLFRWIFLRNKT